MMFGHAGLVPRPGSRPPYGPPWPRWRYGRFLLPPLRERKQEATSAQRIRFHWYPLRA